jgi:hypothetical protein
MLHVSYAATLRDKLSIYSKDDPWMAGNNILVASFY